jgi:hypothetical protein
VALQEARFGTGCEVPETDGGVGGGGDEGAVGVGEVEGEEGGEVAVEGLQ